MSVTGTTTSQAQSLLSSQWVERLGRLGLAARGLVYIVLGIVVALMALGEQHRQATQQGALRTLAAQPYGRVLLWIIAIGLLGYALWQLASVLGPEANGDSPAKTWGKRVQFLVKAGLYVVLAWTAGSIAANSASGSSSSVTADLMTSGAGRLLVGLAGAVIAVVGLALVWQGWHVDFAKKLKTSQMSPSTYNAVKLLGRVGYVARGVVFTIFGVFVVIAAINFDPKKAQGIDVALRAVADAPAGKVLLFLIALGLVAFGLYSFTEVRYRRFQT